MARVATIRIRSRAVSGMRGAIALAGLMALAGCGTANTIENAVPQAALRGPTAGPLPALPEPPPAPEIAVAGDYPNLNVAPQPAAEQRTTVESRSLTNELRATRRDAQRDTGRPMSDSVADMQRRARSQAEALRAAEGAAGTSGTDPEALRRLALTHADETLRQIEGR